MTETEQHPILMDVTIMPAASLMDVGEAFAGDRRDVWVAIGIQDNGTTPGGTLQLDVELRSNMGGEPEDAIGAVKEIVTLLANAFNEGGGMITVNLGNDDGEAQA